VHGEQKKPGHRGRPYWVFYVMVQNVLGLPKTMRLNDGEATRTRIAGGQQGTE